MGKPGYALNKFKSNRKRKLWLSNSKNVRYSLAKLIREFDQDKDADPRRFMAICRGLRLLLDFDKHQAEEAWHERLAAIEGKVALVEHGNGVLRLEQKTEPRLDPKPVGESGFDDEDDE